MTNKLVIIINGVKVQKIKEILLYKMKFLVPNYSCLQNPWVGGYRPQIPFLSVRCRQLNLLNPLPPPNKIPGYATGSRHPLSWRTGGPQIPSGLFGEEESCFFIPGFEPRLLDCQPAAYVDIIHTSLWRLGRRKKRDRIICIRESHRLLREVKNEFLFRRVTNTCHLGYTCCETCDGKSTARWCSPNMVRRFCPVRNNLPVLHI